MNNHIPNNPQPAPVAAPSVSSIVTEVCSGFRSIGASTTQIADFLQANPSELHTASESANAISVRFTELAGALSDVAASRYKMQTAAAEAEKTGWIDDNLRGSGQSVPTANFGGKIPVFNSFQDVYDANSVE